MEIRRNQARLDIPVNGAIVIAVMGPRDQTYMGFAQSGELTQDKSEGSSGDLIGIEEVTCYEEQINIFLQG
jgi:hypothetical protein